MYHIEKVSSWTGRGTQLRSDIGELGKQLDNRNLLISFSFLKGIYVINFDLKR